MSYAIGFALGWIAAGALVMWADWRAFKKDRPTLTFGCPRCDGEKP